MKKVLLPVALIAALTVSGRANSQSNAPKSSSPASSSDASATAGKSIFEGAGGCLACHRVGAQGSVMAPNLSNVASRISEDAMRHQLTEPSAIADPKNRLYEVVLSDGKTVQGKLMNQDPFSIQLLNVNGELVAYQRSQTRDMHPVDPPKMPSSKSTLTNEQIDNLIAYLKTLRAPGD